MASGALFGSTAGRSSSKNLVEFRAGKMSLKGKMVHPDKRKGLVYVYQSDDSLMHFCWKDRSKGHVEDDLIIFPDDVEFKHVTQCTTGRVYLLKFKSSTRKYFFWMQEPKTDKDEENCRKVNEFLNNPPTPGSNRAGGGGGLGALPPELASGLGENDIQSYLGNMSQQQLMQLLGGMGMSGLGGLPSLMGGGGRPSSSTSESAPPPVTSSPAPPSGSNPTPSTAAAPPSQDAPPPATPASNTLPSTPAVPGAPARPTGAGSMVQPLNSSIQLSDLQNILSGMGAVQADRDNVDLTTAVTPDVVIPLLSNPEVRERLLPFLPESESLPRTAEELQSTVQSPQFQQAMSSFSAALASGQLGPLMGQFSLGEDVANAAAQGDVEAFVKALQSALDKKEEEKKNEGKGEDKEAGDKKD